MKPFDLEAAMGGERCITRSGKPARLLGKLESCEKKPIMYPLIFAIKDDDYECLSEHMLSGQYIEDDSCHNDDIFMAPKTKKLWIAITKEENKSKGGIPFYCTSEAYFDDDNIKALPVSKYWTVEVEVNCD